MASRRDPQPELAAAVRALRRRRGLSQERLAHAADLHPSYVSQLESGRANPSWGTMRRVARALDVALADLAAEAERFHP